MRRSILETILGILVLLTAVIFVVNGYFNIETGGGNGRVVEARFGSIDGLTIGSDVRIGGVKVGTVLEQSIDTETYEAIVKFNMDDTVSLSADSRAMISSNGLLGGKYLRIVPGNSDEKIGAAGELSNTKDALSLEDLLGRAIFLVTEQAN